MSPGDNLAATCATQKPTTARNLWSRCNGWFATPRKVTNSFEIGFKESPQSLWERLSLAPIVRAISFIASK